MCCSSLFSECKQYQKQQQSNLLTIKNLEKEYAEQKTNCLAWRNKCHELLDAIDTISSIPENKSTIIQQSIVIENQDYYPQQTTDLSMTKKKLFIEENKSHQMPTKPMPVPSSEPSKSSQIHQHSNNNLKNKNNNHHNNFNSNKNGNRRALSTEKNKSTLSQKSNTSHQLLSPYEPRNVQRAATTPTRYQIKSDNSPISSKEIDENSERLISSTSGTPLVHHTKLNHQYNSPMIYELDLSDNNNNNSKNNNNITCSV